MNDVGYHGGAILSAHLLERPALVRLDTDGAWFGPARGERRVGGRIAVLACVRIGGAEIVLASVHLESHSDPRHRGAQLAALLEAVDTYAPGAPALVGGDLNTLSLGIAQLADPAEVARALEDDPDRWSAPERHEPLFEAARAAGFEWQTCNVLGESTHRIGGAVSTRGALKLDWFLSRNLHAENAQVVAAIDPEGRPLSDHEAIAITIGPR